MVKTLVFPARMKKTNSATHASDRNDYQTITPYQSENFKRIAYYHLSYVALSNWNRSRGFKDRK